jgi:AcrR family transcriptional regulator
MSRSTGPLATASGPRTDSSVPDELSPRAREIASAALELLESEGAGALTMRRLADRLGIRAPSLYKHFADKRALEAAMIAVGLDESARLFEEAVSKPEPLRGLARAYRDFAFARPELYRLMTDGPLPRDLLPAGLEERAAQPVIAASGGDQAAARGLWAFAHGMTILELNRRFPPDADLEPAWERGLAAFAKRRR